jgi:hypothetical protein
MVVRQRFQVDRELVERLQQDEMDAAPAIQKTELHEKIVEEKNEKPRGNGVAQVFQCLSAHDGAARQKITQSHRLGRLVSIRRLHRGIAIVTLEPEVESLRERKMMEMLLQRSPRALEHHVLVHRPLVTHLQGTHQAFQPHRVHVVVPHPLAHEEVLAPHHEDDGFGCGLPHGGLHFDRQRLRADLVRIDDEQPLVPILDLVQRMVALGRIVVELPLVEANVLELGTDLRCCVAAEGIQHDHIIGPGNRFEAAR